MQTNSNRFRTSEYDLRNRSVDSPPEHQFVSDHASHQRLRDREQFFRDQLRSSPLLSSRRATSSNVSPSEKDFGEKLEILLPQCLALAEVFQDLEPLLDPELSRLTKQLPASISRGRHLEALYTVGKLASHAMARAAESRQSSADNPGHDSCSRRGAGYGSGRGLAGKQGKETKERRMRGQERFVKPGGNKIREQAPAQVSHQKEVLIQSLNAEDVPVKMPKEDAMIMSTERELDWSISQAEVRRKTFVGNILRKISSKKKIGSNINKLRVELGEPSHGIVNNLQNTSKTLTKIDFSVEDSVAVASIKNHSNDKQDISVSENKASQTERPISTFGLSQKVDSSTRMDHNGREGDQPTTGVLKIPPFNLVQTNCSAIDAAEVMKVATGSSAERLNIDHSMEASHRVFGNMISGPQPHQDLMSLPELKKSDNADLKCQGVTLDGGHLKIDRKADKKETSAGNKKKTLSTKKSMEPSKAVPIALHSKLDIQQSLFKLQTSFTKKPPVPKLPGKRGTQTSKTSAAVSRQPSVDVPKPLTIEIESDPIEDPKTMIHVVSSKPNSPKARTLSRVKSQGKLDVKKEIITPKSVLKDIMKNTEATLDQELRKISGQDFTAARPQKSSKKAIQTPYKQTSVRKVLQAATAERMKSPGSGLYSTPYKLLVPNTPLHAKNRRQASMTLTKEPAKSIDPQAANLATAAHSHPPTNHQTTAGPKASNSNPNDFLTLTAAVKRLACGGGGSEGTNGRSGWGGEEGSGDGEKGIAETGDGKGEQKMTELERLGHAMEVVSVKIGETSFGSGDRNDVKLKADDNDQDGDCPIKSSPENIMKDTQKEESAAVTSPSFLYQQSIETPYFGLEDKPRAVVKLASQSPTSENPNANPKSVSRRLREIAGSTEKRSPSFGDQKEMQDSSNKLLDCGSKTSLISQGSMTNHKKKISSLVSQIRHIKQESKTKTFNASRNCLNDSQIKNDEPKRAAKNTKRQQSNQESSNEHLPSKTMAPEQKTKERTGKNEAKMQENPRSLVTPKSSASIIISPQSQPDSRRVSNVSRLARERTHNCVKQDSGVHSSSASLSPKRASPHISPMSLVDEVNRRRKEDHIRALKMRIRDLKAITANVQLKEAGDSPQLMQRFDSAETFGMPTSNNQQQNIQILDMSVDELQPAIIRPCKLQRDESQAMDNKEQNESPSRSKQISLGIGRTVHRPLATTLRSMSPISESSMRRNNAPERLSGKSKDTDVSPGRSLLNQDTEQKSKSAKTKRLTFAADVEFDHRPRSLSHGRKRRLRHRRSSMAGYKSPYSREAIATRPYSRYSNKLKKKHELGFGPGVSGFVRRFLKDLEESMEAKRDAEDRRLKDNYFDISRSHLASNDGLSWMHSSFAHSFAHSRILDDSSRMLETSISHDIEDPEATKTGFIDLDDHEANNEDWNHHGLEPSHRLVDTDRTFNSQHSK